MFSMAVNDFSQFTLDGSKIGAEALEKAQERIKDLEMQVTIYEKSELDHRELEDNMRRSFSSFARDIEEKNKQLGIAELRNQELKEENLKIEAQLSGRIDLLLNERKQYEIMNEPRWYDIPRYQVVQMSYYSHHYRSLRVKVDPDKNEVTCVMGVDYIQSSGTQ